MAEVVAVGVPESAVLDVVFLHGLDGDARKTWTGRTPSSFWPVWLAEDFDGVAVWSVGYEAWSMGWRGRAMPMQDRAINLMAQLQNRGIGQRPLCFVTHSMGGLLAKEILLHAAEGRTAFATFATAARGVVFLGTPHTGSGLAKVIEALGVVYRATNAVKDLRRNSAHLRHLNDRYRDWVDESRIRNLVLFEAYPTKGVRVVDEASANPGLSRVRPIAVDADHITICKPADRDSLVYGQVKRFITDILGNVTDYNSVPASSAGVPPAPGGVRKLPTDTGLFVGRTDELARLDEAIAESGRAAVVAVHGLGGVGKSTLAARFAELHSDRFSPVWWVTADSVAAIDSGLADLAVALVPEVAGLPVDQRAERAVAWLSSHTGWLLILDNLATPAHASRLLERVRTGTILITSRQGTGWRGLSTLPLDVLPQDEALELLGRIVRADWTDADLTDGERLCAELGWLPLALEQAGAYVAQTRNNPSRYLELLARFPARMFTATAEGGDAQRTMARVWHVTLDRLADTPLAGIVLRRLAWHASDHISRSLLEGHNEVELSEALGRLAAYSMITLDADTISVHRLVQAVTRTPDPADPHRLPEDISRACAATAESLNHCLAEADHRLPTDWPVFQAVLPHARALLDHTDPEIDTESHGALADRLSCYLRGQGNTTTAIALSTRATHSLERIHGPDHPDTLGSRNNLAAAYQVAGDLERAIPLYVATLADADRLLGPDHPNTMTARSNLAAAYEAAGDLDRAIALSEAAVADRERLLGPDHPDTLSSRNNLAFAYRLAGDLDRAIPLYEATLADRERVLGPHHPDTLSARNNLAVAYQVAGDLDRAIPLLEAAVADRERLLGPNHPDTLSSRNNLAFAYRLAGDLDRAIPLLEAAVADRERVLGPNHPYTLTSRNNLAAAYEAVGDMGRAIPLYEATLADRERVLGPHHPTTLGSRNNLAYAYKAAGDLGRAIPLYEATVPDTERVLGPQHPTTLSLRNNLAAAYQAAGDLERAIPLFEATLAYRERELGPHHADTLSSRNNLAAAYQVAGDLERAIPLFEATLADAQRVLGPEHLLTKTIRLNIELRPRPGC